MGPKGVSRVGPALLCSLSIAAGCGSSGGEAATPPAATGAQPTGQLVPPAGIRAIGRPGVLRVAYAGPRTLRGRVALGARVHGTTRVVAVTFTLAGHPLGTTTVPPWTLDVDAALLARGTAPLQALAVDRLGRRASSSPVAVTVVPGGEWIRRASPRAGLGAALRALAHGSVVVKLSPGRYSVPEISLGPGARLYGSGPATVLAPRPGASDTALLGTRSPDVRIGDLAIMGGGQIDEGVEIGAGSRNVRVQAIEVSGVRLNGVAVWGSHANVSVQDSSMVGGGAALNAGVFDAGSLQSSQTSVVRTTVAGFRGYGILFAQRFHGLIRTAVHNLALDNRVSDIIDPTRHDGTDAGGIWTGGVQAAVIGNSISHTGIDGIETVGSSTADTIIGNVVSDTPVAIYLEHATSGSLIAANRLSRTRTGINIEYRYGGVGSNANTLAYNSIAATRAGVFVDVQDDYNRIVGNAFVAKSTPIILQGSSYNLVRGNSACPGPQQFVVQQPAQSQTGGLAWPSHNRLVSNARIRACAAS